MYKTEFSSTVEADVYFRARGFEPVDNRENAVYMTNNDTDESLMIKRLGFLRVKVFPVGLVDNF